MVSLILMFRRLILTKRPYLYAVHYYVDENNRHRKKRCYLDSEGNYAYISATHDLELYELSKENRYIRYLEEIINLFDVNEPLSTDPDKFKRDFENIYGNKIFRKIIETIVSDIKASIDVLKRDYSDNPEVRDLVKELEAFNKKIDRMSLGKSFVSEETVGSYVERYLQLKHRLRQFSL